MAALHGITKFEPPPEVSDGEGRAEHPLLHRYTNIENYRNFPDLIADTKVVKV